MLNRLMLVTYLFTLLAIATIAQVRTKPLNIAHRGASAHAPEHTMAAYRRAVELGADFVEQDLHMTKDGVLVCIHDAELSRTTNAPQLFPDRATHRDVTMTGKPERGWYVVDFTLSEIKRLDAGSWFNRRNPFTAQASYTVERIPTFQEAIEAIGNRAGLYIELKYYGFYKSLGYDPAEKLSSVLKSYGYDRPDRRSRVFVQSFWKSGLLRMSETGAGYQRIQLLPMEDPGRQDETSDVSPKLAREIAQYAAGVGVSKGMIAGRSQVDILKSAGLLVHVYTFRGPTTAVARRPLDEKQSTGLTLRETVIEEIRRYVGFGIDGGFTDYPDLWKQVVDSRDRQ